MTDCDKCLESLDVPTLAALLQKKLPTYQPLANMDPNVKLRTGMNTNKPPTAGPQPVQWGLGTLLHYLLLFTGISPVFYRVRARLGYKKDCGCNSRRRRLDAWTQRTVRKVLRVFSRRPSGRCICGRELGDCQASKGEGKRKCARTTQPGGAGRPEVSTARPPRPGRSRPRSNPAVPSSERNGTQAPS